MTGFEDRLDEEKAGEGRVKCDLQVPRFSRWAGGGPFPKPGITGGRMSEKRGSTLGPLGLRCL